MDACQLKPCLRHPYKLRHTPVIVLGPNKGLAAGWLQLASDFVARGCIKVISLACLIHTALLLSYYSKSSTDQTTRGIAQGVLIRGPTIPGRRYLGLLGRVELGGFVLRWMDDISPPQ
jgi:hypothetical protein